MRYRRSKAETRILCTAELHLVIARLTDSQGQTYEESDRLGKSADAQDVSSIEEWILRDPWRRVHSFETDRLTTMQRLMRAMTKFFDRHKIVH